MVTREKRASAIWTQAKGLAFLKIFLRPEAQKDITKAVLSYWISAIHEVLKSSGACNCEDACWLHRFTDQEKIEWVKRSWCQELSFETFWREVTAMYMLAVYFRKVRSRKDPTLVN